MSMRHVEVFTLARSARALVGDRLHFQEMRGFAPVGSWQEVPGTEKVIHYDEPVQRLVDLDGEEYFIAMDRRVTALLTHACEEKLRSKLRDQEREIDSLQELVRIKQADADRFERDAHEFLGHWEYSLKTIAEATLWRRIKYLFTRRL